MPKTISFHNGTAWSRGHNIRDERYTDKQEHIDKALSEQNVIVRDMPARQAYAEIFGQAVEEYNEKQKRSDRRITDYYDKIKKDKRKHPVYECIVQIGDRSDTGNTAEQEKQALIRFAEEWDKRNPNLRLIGAYIHCDEPDGTVHMHCDYIPVAECTRGMRLQNSLDRALQQQGFHSENIHQTAQIAWQDSEREALCAICRDLGIDAQRNQGIGKGRKSLTPQEYRRAKEEQQFKIEDELKPLKEELDEYRQLDVSAKAFVVEKKKAPFSKRVTVSVEDIEQLEEQAEAYRVNRQEVYTLRVRKAALDERERQLDEREQQLDEKGKYLNERLDQLGENQRVLQKNRHIVEQMYERQKRVNQLLEQSECKVSSLSAENVSLTDQVAEMDRTIERLREWLDRREQQLGECSQQLRESQEALQDSQCIIQQMDDRQDEVSRSLEQLKCRVSFLTTENDSLTAQIADKDKTVDEFQERLRTALQTVREACESVSSIVKAVSMLKYDRENGYGVELTEKQGRLIDAIVKYGSRWMDKTDEKIGISQSIQENIRELAPKKTISRGRGGMSL